MDPMVQAAGTAVVQAMTTDGWQQVKRAVAGLWRRVRPGDVERAGSELDELRRQVLQARTDGDPETEQALEGAWRLKLQHLVRAHPAAAEELQEILDQVLTPALPAAGQARVGAILMTGTSRDSSTFTQIGSQVNYGRP